MEMRCAYCNKDIVDCYSKIEDNFMVRKYFDDPDGTDNIFCDHDCICDSLSVRDVTLDILDEEVADD